VLQVRTVQFVAELSPTPGQAVCVVQLQIDTTHQRRAGVDIRLYDVSALRSAAHGSESAGEGVAKDLAAIEGVGRVGALTKDDRGGMVVISSLSDMVVIKAA
jgi:hypothetical protein